MNVTCLSTGLVRGKRAHRGPRRYLPGGWSRETRPVNVFLLDHRDGLCLFDTGQTVRAAEPGYHPRWHPFMHLSRFELGRADQADVQLARMGVEPGDLRWIVLSHLHTDHMGGLADLVDGRADLPEVLVSRVEWERAQGFGGQVRGYLPQHWPAAARPRLVDFVGPPAGPFFASFDLAGDGTLVLVPTPGHTPGHLALLARDGDRAYLCAGDMALSAEGLATVTPQVAEHCRREGIAVLTTHDPLAPQMAGGRRTNAEAMR